MNDKVKIGALWKRTTKDGRAYYSGVMGDAQLLVFETQEKRSSKSPDYLVYVAPRKRRDDDAEQSKGAAMAPPPDEAPEDFADDDIPF